MRRFFFFLVVAGLASPMLHAFPAGRYTVKGTGNGGTVIELTVSVPNGDTQAVAVIGGRIFGSNIVAATPAEARKGEDTLRVRLQITVEDSHGRLHTYIVDLEGSSEAFRNRNPEDHVGSYHEAGSKVVHVLTA